MEGQGRRKNGRFKKMLSKPRLVRKVMNVPRQKGRFVPYTWNLNEPYNGVSRRKRMALDEESKIRAINHCVEIHLTDRDMQKIGKISDFRQASKRILPKLKKMCKLYNPEESILEVAEGGRIEIEIERLPDFEDTFSDPVQAAYVKEGSCKMLVRICNVVGHFKLLNFDAQAQHTLRKFLKMENCHLKSWGGLFCKTVAKTFPTNSRWKLCSNGTGQIMGMKSEEQLYYAIKRLNDWLPAVANLHNVCIQEPRTVLVVASGKLPGAVCFKDASKALHQDVFTYEAELSPYFHVKPSKGSKTNHVNMMSTGSLTFFSNNEVELIKLAEEMVKTYFQILKCAQPYG